MRNHRHPRRPSMPSPRQGALVVEGALVAGTFLFALFASLDLALAVERYNTISVVARRVAREAVVRGVDAPPRRTTWGPVTYEGTVGDGSEYAASAVPIVLGRPEEYELLVEWPDGNHTEGDRVKVTVRSRHRPLVPLLFGTAPVEFVAVSTMRIVN